MEKREYKICSNCIMDTSDPGIAFDREGRCDYCRNFYDNIKPNWHPEEGERTLAPLIKKIKKEGEGKDYDSLIGISGGIDSSYVAYVAKEKFGLRPLLFHCDAGWNSDISSQNIQKIQKGLGLDLHTEVVDWEEMKDLQVAFFKSQVPFVDTPQDLALFSAIYNFAAKNNFKYIITGGNYSTECVRECLDWTYYTTDMRQVRDIHRRFGTRKLQTFPTCDIFKYKIYYRFIKGMQVIKLLDYAPYIKEEAMRELTSRFGWQPYQQKHYESRFTRFYESFWTPKKFGYDKRRAYLSSLILTGQMTRDEALEKISKPELDEQTMAREFEYVAKKLDLTVEEFRKIFEGENKSFRNYKNNLRLISLGTTACQLLGIEKRLFR
ncbi:MAG: N-acetyl sugar amidotransferase [Candidatus Omnitrophota bacterium]